MRKTIAHIIAVILLGTYTATAQDSLLIETPTKELKYFDKSSPLNIDTNNDYTGFDLLQPAISKNYRVYFTGENHTFTESNSLLQLKMFKYLHKNAGVNTLFMEFGHSRGWVVNEYIQTGDSTLLDVLKGYSFLEFADMYKGLMEYNKTLAADNKIKVIGIDVERHFPLAVKAMQMSLPNKEAPAEIMLQIESLRGLARYYDEMAKKRLDKEETETEDELLDYFAYNGYNDANTMADVIDNFKEYDSLYKVYLGNNYELYKRIALGLEQREDWERYNRERMTQGYVFREQYMYKEFMRNLKENPDDKFFAQFGRCHVSIITQSEACNWYEYNSIAQRLNNSSDKAIRGKVCTIAVFYPNDESDIKMSNKFKCVKAFMDSAQDSGMTIFNILNTPDSCANLYKQYQYVIVNRYSPNPEYFGYADIPTLPVPDVAKGKRADMTVFNITQRSFNFDNLNKHFATYANGSALKEEVQGFGLNFHKINRKGVSSRWGFGWYNSSGVNLDNNTTVNFSATTFGLMFGKDIFSNSYFDLIPHLGMQFGRMKLKYQADTIVTGSAGSLFGEKTTVYYRNPFSAFEANLTMLYRISGILGIGAEVGYIYDISKKGWRLEDENLNNTPEQTATGYYAGIMLTVDLSKVKSKKKPPQYMY